METNENSESKENHEGILRLVTSLFRGPYLPTSLLVFLALTILTDYTYVLLREPKIYWLDYSRESINAIGGYQFGPLFALGFYLIYIALVWVVLRILNQKISIILWCGAIILHSSTYLLVSPICNNKTLLTFPYWFLCQYNNIIIPLVIGAIIGLVLSRGFLQKEFKPADSEYRGRLISKLGLSRLGIAFSVIWLLLLGLGVVNASRIPSQGWKPIFTKNSPSPRYETMVAYDLEHNQAILFGGSIERGASNWTKASDTWKWDSTSWIQLHPQASPPARARGAMTYDPKHKVIVLFGGWDDLGKSLNDTWTWDGKTWKEVGNCETCIRPPSRGCHNMFYDTTRQEVILYGGCNEYKSFFNDAWSWNGNNWEYIEIQNSPIASGAPIVYDPNKQQAVGFLAWQPSGTWIWDKNGWSKPTLETLILEPPLRGNAVMAFDTVTGNSLMFGGCKTENNVTIGYDDTWIFNGNTWNEVKSSLRPPGRWGHVIFFDVKLQKFILFGGHDGKIALNDLWEISIPAD